VDRLVFKRKLYRYTP